MTRVCRDAHAAAEQRRREPPRLDQPAARRGDTINEIAYDLCITPGAVQQWRSEGPARQRSRGDQIEAPGVAEPQ
jgi:hypothetical protein